MIPDPAAKRRPQLGRGLSALLGDTDPATTPAGEAAESPQRVPIERVFANPHQPRRRFSDIELAELALSIREQGILQPLLVRPRPGGADGDYEIVAGERRWRAAQQVQLHEIPVVIRAIDDDDALQLSIIENVQRQDLSCLEEANAYRRLIDSFGHTQESIAGLVGKSRSHIANSLRLLGLPDGVRALIESGALTAGHARALLSLDDPQSAAEDVVRRGLNVRQTEALAQRDRRPKQGAAAPTVVARPSVDALPPGAPFDDPFDRSGTESAPAPVANQDAMALESDLSDRLGMRVTIAARAAGKGAITLEYQSLEQLDYIIARLTPTPGVR